MAFSDKTCRLAIFVVFLLLLFFISARIAQSFPTENEGVETTMSKLVDACSVYVNIELEN